MFGGRMKRKMLVVDQSERGREGGERDRDRERQRQRFGNGLLDMSCCCIAVDS